VTHPSSIGQLLYVDPSPRTLKWTRVLVVSGTAAAVTAAMSAALQWPSFISGLDLVGAGFFAGVAIYFVVYLRRLSERVARMPLQA
jgi:hypothetical protein